MRGGEGVEDRKRTREHNRRGKQHINKSLYQSIPFECVLRECFLSVIV